MAKKGLVTSKLSRKIIHIGTGPIFVLCWLLFNNDPSARWLAATVPLLITIQFISLELVLLRMRHPSKQCPGQATGGRSYWFHYFMGLFLL